MASRADAAAAARRYRRSASLRDGGRILLRAVRPNDRERLREAFHRLSPQSVYYRFFEFKRELTEADLSYYTELDFDRHVGLVATIEEEGRERIAGVSRYVRSGDGDSSLAEAAFAVVDAHQGRGVGTLMLDHLAGLAAAAGIGTFEAEVLADNRKMLEVFEHSGFRIHEHAEAGVLRVTLELAKRAGTGPGD